MKNELEALGRCRHKVIDFENMAFQWLPVEVDIACRGVKIRVKSTSSTIIASIRHHTYASLAERKR